MSDQPLEIMLRELRRLGANRGEPCGVHEEPQWTCAFCLHEVLASHEKLAAQLAATHAAIRALRQKDEELLACEPEGCPCAYCQRLRHRTDAFREVSRLLNGGLEKE